MITHFPIPSPPPELVASLRNSAPHNIRDAGVTREIWLINHAYAAGADQELEACCAWLDRSTVGMADLLHAARRPKPPSEAEQALDALKDLDQRYPSSHQAITIRAALERLRALEQLPDALQTP